ncbi:hypothetical protein PPYR_05969 [Photinus pyralis]|uniref:Scavenger receptor class B member 1 n=1 Tax=Photinus pyralis TaxID=7054 RepID=A0A5N4ASF1_PHOPY|nr:scavenger receptor class B member 1-like [Photinus pyralis]KAB0800229.1 hypothetical protein PPYR_05969 [Photinus pyralis]
MKFTYIEHAKLLLLSILGAFLATLSYLTHTYNPLEFLIDKVTGFYPDSILFNLWKNPPYVLLLRIYLFNVTNPQEFLDGTDKLRFQEVGPYVFKESLFNINSTFNDNGTISFIPKRRLEFQPQHSIGNPDVDKLLLPNLALLGMSAALSEHSMFVQLGLSSLSSYYGMEPFNHITVTDFLYGYDDPLVSLANDFVPNWIDFSRLGILDRIMALDNASNVVTMNLNQHNNLSDNHTMTTEESMPRPFSIQTWNGFAGFKQWGYESGSDSQTPPSTCNAVEGAFMGTLFPRHINKNDTFYLYRHAFCRTIPITFENVTTTQDGFEGYLFRVKRDFLATREENAENECYCISQKCLRKGLGDLSPCYYTIPIVVSQPHFFNADPTLLEEIGGMSPNETKHDTTMTIHPHIGVPLEANLRLQANLAMPDSSYNSKTKPFSNLVLPLLWIDLIIDQLPPKIQLYLKLLYHILPIVQDVVVYVFAVASIFLIFGPAVKIFLYPSNTETHHNSFHVKYSQIPVFSLRTKIFDPDILIQK